MPRTLAAMRYSAWSGSKPPACPLVRSMNEVAELMGFCSQKGVQEKAPGDWDIPSCYTLWQASSAVGQPCDSCMHAAQRQ